MKFTSVFFCKCSFDITVLDKSKNSVGGENDAILVLFCLLPSSYTNNRL